ncbi:MAG: rRNA maturation RNase YbeY [Halobacteriovoraceae bacterium]|nr:rRNA maturation RNase YbeY [Halobacteriovoraceae bacterium]|tara:strand:+ start:807 stop:1397 length:591 start_codon:yes stop_codon:yes gene_type:complete
MSNDDLSDNENFLELQATGVDPSLFQAELTWNIASDEWPFEKGFEKKFNLALGVLQRFICEGHKDFPALKTTENSLESLFLHISLCDDEQMIELNRTHRNKDKTTDVLSFPLYDELRSGKEMIFSELEFGDIIISLPVMKKQAVEFNVSPEGEFFHLVTHGFLHLCGYDHELSEKEEELMEYHEQRIIKEIYDLIY